VSTYQVSGGEGEVVPADSFSLNFSKIQVEYKQQKPDGSLGTSIKAGWDVKQNKKALTRRAIRRILRGGRGRGRPAGG
jgi:type VI secretion system secreted protein Hcp